MTDKVSIKGIEYIINSHSQGFYLGIDGKPQHEVVGRFSRGTVVNILGYDDSGIWPYARNMADLYKVVYALDNTVGFDKDEVALLKAVLKCVFDSKGDIYPGVNSILKKLDGSVTGSVGADVAGKITICSPPLEAGQVWSRGDKEYVSVDAGEHIILVNKKTFGIWHEDGFGGSRDGFKYIGSFRE